MSRLKVCHLATCMLATAMGFAATAIASPPIPLAPPASPVFFDAGVACEFPVRLDLSGSKLHYKAFFDKNGDFVRVMIAGKGSKITVTNEDTLASLSLNAYGVSLQETADADGIITDIFTGHIMVSMFPSDIPAGPSTTLYVGRLVMTIDSNTGVSTIQSFSGKETDICAALD